MNTTNTLSVAAPANTATTGTLTVANGSTSSSTYIYPNNAHTHTINTAGYVNTWPASYGFTQEGDKLVVRDPEGRECLAIKNGILMIGDRTIHQVILDVVDMINGDKPFTELLVDPDQGKRELGKEIYERRRRKQRKAKRKKPLTTEKE